MFYKSRFLKIAKARGLIQPGLGAQIALACALTYGKANGLSPEEANTALVGATLLVAGRLEHPERCTHSVKLANYIAVTMENIMEKRSAA